MNDPDSYQRSVFDALVAARPILLESFDVDSCIASTRIGIAALDYFGIRARELPVQVLVINAEADAFVSSGGSQDELAAIMQASDLSTPGGPWTLMLGSTVPQPTRPGWAGHLVIAVDEVGVVIDLSADQAARPHKGLDLKPFWGRISDPAWWDGTERRVWTRLPGHDGGAMLWDREPPDPLGYLVSPNWGSRDRNLIKTITGQVIRAMKTSLRQQGAAAP